LCPGLSDKKTRATVAQTLPSLISLRRFGKGKTKRGKGWFCFMLEGFITSIAATVVLAFITFIYHKKIFRKSFVDKRDKQKYRIVKIGSQIWMAENLNYNIKGSKCCNKEYGRLYDWKAAKMAIPPGWRLPTDDDWKTLANSAGGIDEAGNKLKAKHSWTNGNGTDDYKFSALPGGDCSPDGNFGGAGNFGSWWTDTECKDDTTLAFNWHLNSEGFKYKTQVHDGYYHKSQLFSVRCIKC
jgi:uncharacterized protein (TIGR02145 family)